MDAHDREKAQQEAIENLLGRALRRTLEPGGEACPAPDVLAAFHEANLSAEERKKVEAHVSVCFRCQEALAALVVSEPEAVLAEAALAAAPAMREPVRSEERPNWFALHWRWLAPVATLATVAAMWIAVGRSPHLQEPVSVASRAPAPTAPAPAAQDPLAPQGKNQIAKNIAPPASGPAPERAKIPVPKPGELDALRKLTASASKPAGGIGATSLPGAVGTPGDTIAEKGAVAGPPATPAEGRAQAQKLDTLDEQARQALQKKVAAQRAEGEAPATPGVAGGLPGVVAQTVTVMAGDAPVPPAQPRAEKSKQVVGRAVGGVVGGVTPAPAAESALAANIRERPLSRLALNAVAVPPLQVIPTPDARVLFRVGPGGRIERSADSGKTWEPQSSGVTADLLAGSAPSAKICWVVGAAGTILRTTDGRHWKNVNAPAALSWTRVLALDDKRAVLTSADEKRYVTTDGGKTWQKQ
jgi:hypothetical protein